MYLNDQDITVVAHVGVDAAFAPVAVWSIHCAGPCHVGDFFGFRFGIVFPELNCGLSESFSFFAASCQECQIPTSDEKVDCNIH